MYTFFAYSKTALSEWLDRSEWLLLIAGLVLVIGIIGEYTNAPRWERWKPVFGIMVMLSVTAELIADGGIFLFSRRLQIINDKEIASLNFQTEQARKESEVAHKEAESERLARVKIEKSMEWRRLSKGAKESLCKILPPQTSADLTAVVTLWTDPEPALYATEFRDTIATCRPIPGNKGAQGPALAISSWTFPMRFGVWLEFPARDERTAKSLADALRANGVDVTIPSGKERQFPKAENRLIFVGPRPYPNGVHAIRNPADLSP